MLRAKLTLPPSTACLRCPSPSTRLLDGPSDEPATDSAIGEEQTPYRAHFDEGIKRVARSVESVVNRHNAVVDWQSNLEVLREMRRDIKRELRPTDDYTEEQLEELANRIVDLAPPEESAVTERDRVRFGDTTIDYEVRRSERRKKTVQITADGGGVLVAAPMTTPDSDLPSHSSQAGALDPQPCVWGDAGSCTQALRQRRDPAVPGAQRPHDRRYRGRAFA